jgi:hypothetical protein
MRSILAAGISAVQVELDKLPEETKIALVAIAEKQPGQDASAEVYVAYKPDKHWRIDVGAAWQENKGLGAKAQVVFSK